MGADEDRKRRLYALEMGMLRTIAGVRWDYFVTNIQLQGSFKLRRVRLKWFRRVERMGGERQVQKIMNA